MNVMQSARLTGAVIFLLILTISFQSNAQENNETFQILVDASSNNFPPMNILNEDGHLIGFGRDLADAAMKAVGVEVKHIHSSHWDEVLKWLDSGKADFIHDTGYTKDRDEFLDYSKTIIEMPETIFVRSDQYDITGLHSLKGKKVACVNKHISHTYLQSFPGISCYVVKTPVEGIFELISKNVDAFVYPKQIVLYLTQNLRLTDKIKITGDPLRVLTWSMVVKEGNKEVLSLLNEGIEEVKKSGEYDRIYDKWWGKRALTGYSKKELQIITTIAVVMAIIVVSLIALLIYSQILRSRKNKLKKEISQRKRVETQLRESEKKYRAFFQNSCDPMLILHAGVFIDCNDAAVMALGYQKAEEIINLPPSALSPEYQLNGKKTTDKKAEVVEIAYRQGSHRFEWEHQKKNGDVFPVEVSLTAMPSEGKMVLLVVWRDISNQKRAEARNERLIMAIEQSAESIVITDTNATIQYVNPAFETITGYSHEEVLGKNPNVLKSGEQNKSFYQNMWNILQKPATWTGRLINKKKDGTLYTEEATISPVLNASDKVVNYVAVKRDITDEIKIENRLQQAQKMEAIGSLAGGIAHDFNNILVPIVGMAEMLIEDLSDKKPEQQYAREIFRAGKRAADLVQQILAFGRQTDHKTMPIKIQSVIKEVLKLCRSTIPSDIEIKQDIQHDCGLVKADSTQIHQVAMNLITNAYHAVAEKSGRISVHLKDFDLCQGDFPESELKPGRYVQCTVSDTGCGIEPGVMDKIFEPYFTTKEQGKGTGLGLATVYGIVKEYQGDITVYSELGKGTTFNVFLPVLEETDDTEIAPHPERLQTGTERILLVDDEEPIAEIEKLMLEKLGYSVISFTNSIEALKAFQSNPKAYDLIITDMTMPQMTGDLLSRALKEIRHDIPILICTGFSERIDQKKMEAIGVNGILMKPIARVALSKKVREILGKKVI